MNTTLTAEQKVFKFPINYIILLVIVSLPLSVKLNSIAIISLCLVMVIYSFKKQIKLKPTLLWFYCIPFLFDLFGLLYTSNFNNGMEFVIRRLTIFLFPIIFSLIPISKRKLRLFCYTFVFVCSLIGLGCLIWAIYQQIIWSIKYNNWEINWFIFSYHNLVKIISIHAVYFSIYVGFSISFLTIELFQSHKKSLTFKAAIVGLIIFNFFILFLLAARLPIAATLLFFICFVNYFLWKKSKSLTAGVNLLIILVLLFAFSQFTILKERFLGAFNLQQETEYIHVWGPSKGNITVRYQKWHGTLLVIMEDPILGTGTGDLHTNLMEKYKEIGFIKGIDAGFDPHNQFLNTTARTGMFSGLIYILMFLLPAFYSLITRKLLYLSFLIIVFSVSLTESVLSSQKGIVFYSLFNSILFSYSFINNEKYTTKLS